MSTCCASSAGAIPGITTNFQRASLLGATPGVVVPDAGAISWSLLGMPDEIWASGSRATRLAHNTRLMCWIWAGLVLGLCVLDEPGVLHISCVLAAADVVAASLAREEETNPKSKWLIATTAAFASVAINAGIALAMGLWTSRHLAYVPDIGTVLSHNLNDTLSMSHALDLTSSSFAALRLPATGSHRDARFSAAGAHFACAQETFRRHLVGCAGNGAVPVRSAHCADDPYSSSEDLANVISERLKPNDKVMIYGDQAFGSSLLFYLQRPILLVNGDSTSMWFGSTYPDAPHIFLDDNDLKTAWSSSQRVFLFVPPQHVKDVEKVLPINKNVIAESSGKVVYSNCP